jgi:UDP-N-acetylmuramate-alanine ligase
MISHILKENGVNFTAFIGGIAKDFKSNLHLGDGNEKIMVVEADEFDHSFLQLEPNVSIVTSIDADHLDIYGDKQHLIDSFNEFVNKTDENGQVVFKSGLPIKTERNASSFGFDESCDYFASDIRQKAGETMFKLHCPDGTELNIELPLAGKHNIMNAMAAFIVCLLLQLKKADIAHALQSYQGVSRRFDIRLKNKKHCYIDDYAHHPEEIKSCLSAIRDSFPDKRLTVIFQPHLFTRTRDFMEEFARSLSMADELILLDIYPAREKPIEGISSQALLEKIELADKQICAKSELLDLINKKRPELLLTMGAGDIDRFVQPLENMIKTW